MRCVIIIDVIILLVIYFKLVLKNILRYYAIIIVHIICDAYLYRFKLLLNAPNVRKNEKSGNQVSLLE